MKMHHIQPTFAGGEFAPSLHARVDVAKYGTGLKTCKNFIVHPHGGVSNRAGTRFVAEVKDSTKKVRLVPFEFSTEQAYMLEFGEYYCRFYMDGGQIILDYIPNAYNAGTAYVVDDYVIYSAVVYRCIAAGTGQQPDIQTAYWSSIVAYVIGVDIPYEISTPYTEADLTGLRYTQSADILFIVHPDTYPQQLTRYDHDNWTIADFTVEDGPFMLINLTTKTIAASAVTGAGITLTASASEFTADNVGSLYKISHDMSGEAVGAAHTATATSSVINCNGGWRMFATVSTFVGTIELQYSTDGGANWKLLRKYTNVAVAASGTEDEFVQLRYVVTLTSGTVTIDLNTDPYTRAGVAKITAYASGTSVTATILATLASTAATVNWSEGSWSPENGYPSTIGFYQDRLCFARTYNEPQLVWASVTGSYASFARSSPLQDTDGMSVALPSYKVNGVVAIVPLGDIVALTSSAEWSVGPTIDGVFTPTSVQTRCQGYRGSASLQPVVIGNKIIYVQPSGATVRDLGYGSDSRGYTGDNISIFSNHMFTGYTITDLAYQQDPDSIVWFVRSDGTLLALTYLKEQEVIAWTRHDTAGTIEAVAIIPANGYDEVWLSIARTVGGGTKRYVERMERRTISTAPKDQFYVDSGLSYSGVAATELEGLDHLEGLTVVVLADGNVVNDLVVASGAITLSIAAEEVHIGLPYESDFETLNIELPDSKSGTMQGRHVQVPNLFIRFLNSRGGWVGATEDNLVEIVQRAGEPLDTAILLYTGDYEATIPSRFDNGGRVFIRQIDPLPMTILAVMPTVNLP